MGRPAGDANDAAVAFHVAEESVAIGRWMHLHILPALVSRAVHHARKFAREHLYSEAGFEASAPPSPPPSY